KPRRCRGKPGRAGPQRRRTSGELVGKEPGEKPAELCLAEDILRTQRIAAGWLQSCGLGSGSVSKGCSSQLLSVESRQIHKAAVAGDATDERGAVDRDVTGTDPPPCARPADRENADVWFVDYGGDVECAGSVEREG